MRGDPTAFLERFQAQGDPLSQHVLSVHAQSKAGHGNADLGRGDVAILSPRIFEDTRHTPRQATALGRLMLDTGPRRADDRELRGHKQAVGNHQEKDDAKRDEQFRHSSLPVSSWATRRARAESSAWLATRSTSNS